MRGAAILGALALAIAGCADINSDEPADPFGGFFVEPTPIPFHGNVWRSSEPPPPVTGGHLAVLDDGTIAVADPDGRTLSIVPPEATRPSLVVPLPGEPGRVAADGAGRVHVVLRDAAAIASVDPVAGTISTRRVCASPRGLGYDAQTGALFVACLDGRVQRLDPAGGGAVTLATLEEGDLRDIVPQPEGLWVTHFRSARISLLGRDGTRERVVTIPALESARESRIASVAWRAVPRPGGGIVVSHQRHTNRTVSTVPPEDESFASVPVTPYGGGFNPTTGECTPPLVTSAITVIGPDGSVERSSPAVGALPVDVALQGDRAVAVSAALSNEMMSVWSEEEGAFGRLDPCARSRDGGNFVEGQAVSIAVLPDGGVVLQARFPSMVYARGRVIPLGDGYAQDIGHALFHADTTSSLACASCHPEAGEDGVRWSFFGVGPRRTQELRGGLLATAPFHWAGDQPTLRHIMNDTFRGRMGGGEPTEVQMDAVGQWLDATPLPALEPSELATEGRGVFERAGCADCHAGAQLTNNELADFGRGPLQVPTLLGVSFRGPWMHDGCARTLEGTIVASCAGEGHSVRLDERELGALLAYLRTL
ncbi:MAG TPA: hypothetical protein VIL20_17735 [Sandaracinaceae bacterium]